MKVKSGREATQLCPTLRDPTDCSPPGSSVQGIFQARVLEWGAIACLKGLQPGSPCDVSFGLPFTLPSSCVCGPDVSLHHHPIATAIAFCLQVMMGKQRQKKKNKIRNKPKTYRQCSGRTLDAQKGWDCASGQKGSRVKESQLFPMCDEKRQWLHIWLYLIHCSVVT